MGKLVLFLKDATPVEIPLVKERVTIGRRPDNDVCLPYPAVSGEHAAVVTILADSFLEDLGSTNGTLVNGRPVAKHFLRDRDQIDIGRQLIVYLGDDGAKAEPPSAAAERGDRRDLVARGEEAANAGRIGRRSSPPSTETWMSRSGGRARDVPAARPERPARDPTRGRLSNPAPRATGPTRPSTPSSPRSARRASIRPSCCPPIPPRRRRLRYPCAPACAC